MRLAIIKQALKICLGAGLLAFGLGAARGLPSLPDTAPATAAGACAAPVPEHPQIRWIDADQARALLDESGVTFVDARSRQAFVQGHVAGALSVPIEDGTIGRGVLESLHGAATVIAYCDGAPHCNLSTRLAGLLAAEGIGDVRVLEGGAEDWFARNYPAESGTCRLCPPTE